MDYNNNNNNNNDNNSNNNNNNNNGNDNGKNKPRKRDKVMHGIDKVASKLGFSSHSPAGQSNVQDGLTTTVTSAMTMMPAVSQGYKNWQHPAPQPSPQAQNPGQVIYKAPPEHPSAGKKSKTATKVNRLLKLSKSGNKDPEPDVGTSGSQPADTNPGSKTEETKTGSKT